MNISQRQRQFLAMTANTIRQDIVTMIHTAKSGHPGGALGLADVFAVLYYQHAHISPANEKEKDYILLSNGHTCPVLYAALAGKGFFPKTELANFRKINGLLQGHPHTPTIPGVENSGGPLGQGTSQAVGIAIGLKMDHNPHHVYCVTGDGESEEGQVWEALMLAAKNNLDNLTFIVDKNNIQIDGPTEKVSSVLDNLQQKYESFGWKAWTIDGHNIEQIAHKLAAAKDHKRQPTVLIANTTAGKGVSFMENDFHWHGKAPNDEEYNKAMQELKVEQRKITQAEQ